MLKYLGRAVSLSLTLLFAAFTVAHIGNGAPAYRWANTLTPTVLLALWFAFECWEAGASPNDEEED